MGHDSLWVFLDFSNFTVNYLNEAENLDLSVVCPQKIDWLSVSWLSVGWGRIEEASPLLRRDILDS